MSDLLSLLSSADPADDDQQQALIAALRGQQAYGQLGQLTGDRVLSQFGTSADQGAQQQIGQLQAATRARLTLALEARKAQNEQANQEAQRDLQGQGLAQQAQYQQGELGLRRKALEQGKFAVNAATGALYNAATGEEQGAAGGKPLHPSDAAKLDAVLQGIPAIDQVKAARSGGLTGWPAYSKTLEAEAPAIAAAESGTGRASGQADIIKRAPGYIDPSHDAFYDTTRKELVDGARAKIAALKQSGFNVAEHEARLQQLAGAAPAAAAAPGAPAIRKFTRGTDGKLVEVK